MASFVPRLKITAPPWTVIATENTLMTHLAVKCLALVCMQIFNTCLKQHVYLEAWKLEYVTWIQKFPQPKKISDLRKISLTSQYSKLFEGFLKDWILEDIKHHVDPSQYGARKGSGTEHLIVAYFDRVLKCFA